MLERAIHGGIREAARRGFPIGVALGAFFIQMDPSWPNQMPDSLGPEVSTWDFSSPRSSPRSAGQGV